MMKTTVAAAVSSLATAMLLGIALAAPKQGAPQREEARPRNVQIKMEWVRANPRSSESLVISVDEGRKATVSRPISDGAGAREVSVTPILKSDGTINLTLHIQSDGANPQGLETTITMPLDETKVISASTVKSAGKTGAESREEMFFVTPSVG